MKKHIYRVVELDVGGNEKEVYDINNWFKTPYTVETWEGITDREILNQLKEQNIVKKHIKLKQCDFRDFGCSEYFELNEAKTGRPVFQFELEGEVES